MIKKLLTAAAILGILGTTSIALAAFNSTGGGTYYLQASISSSQTTITLSSFTEPVSNIPYTMSYLNTDIMYGTIAPQSVPNEFISFTGITQNANGTATLTGVTRGLDRSYPFTASTTLAKPYPGQTRFILSTPPQFFNEYAARRNTQSITGTWSFSPTGKPQYSSNPSFGAGDGNAFVNYSTLLATAIQGAGTSTESSMGIVQLSTYAQIVAGTASSTAGAPLVIPTRVASSTPFSGTPAGTVPATGAIGGKLSQLYFDLSQIWNFTASVGIGTSSPYLPLSVAGSAVVGNTLTLSSFSATSTTASSTIVNLQVTNNASTTNLTVSGVCTGCSISDRYMGTSTPLFSSASRTYTAPTGAKEALISFVYTGNTGGGANAVAGQIDLPVNGNNNVQTGGVTAAGTGTDAVECTYTWNTNVSITNACTITTSVVTGNIFWYK